MQGSTFNPSTPNPFRTRHPIPSGRAAAAARAGSEPHSGTDLSALQRTRVHRFTKVKKQFQDRRSRPAFRRAFVDSKLAPCPIIPGSESAGKEIDRVPHRSRSVRVRSAELERSAVASDSDWKSTYPFADSVTVLSTAAEGRIQDRASDSASFANWLAASGVLHLRQPATLQSCISSVPYRRSVSIILCG